MPAQSKPNPKGKEKGREREGGRGVCAVEVWGMRCGGMGRGRLPMAVTVRAGQAWGGSRRPDVHLPLVLVACCSTLPCDALCLGS